MKAVTPDQMNNIDRRAIEQFGIPGIILMEHAASRLLEKLKSRWPNLEGKTIVIIAGKGNNGGDGLALARMLMPYNAKVLVYLLARVGDLRGDAQVNGNILVNLGVTINTLLEEGDLNALKEDIERADVIVDAILGTGIRGMVTGLTQRVIELINQGARYVLSVDIPSGVNGTTGEVMNTCVRAHDTVTFQLPKVGQLVHPGKEYTGHLEIVDIGIPKPAWVQDDINIEYLTSHEIAEAIRPRKLNAHKGDFGHLLVVAGSRGMAGAAIMSCISALKTGCGMVTLAIPKSLYEIIGVSIPEVMVISLPEDEDGRLGSGADDVILNSLDRFDGMVFGPGLGKSQQIFSVLRNIIEVSDIPIIIDADGINALSSDISILKKGSCSISITPHPGEMARLINKPVPLIEKNRLEESKLLAKNYDINVLLKGNATIVALPTGQVFINSTGNPGMATAGSGDVLSGVIGSFMVQGARPCDALYTGAFIHGLAGDMAAHDRGRYGMTAMDIVEFLPDSIKAITGE